jgi:hypothetical protein
VCESWILSNYFSDWELVMQYAYMNIHVHIEDHIVELIGIDDTSSPHGGYVNAWNFKIMGTHLGITTLYVSPLLINTNILRPQLAFIVRFSVGKLGHASLKIILDIRSVLHSNLDKKF